MTLADIAVDREMKRVRCRHHLFGGIIAAAMAALLLPGIPWVGRADDKTPFARWEPAIAAFEKQDREKPPPKDAVLFVGSSSIRLWDLPKHFPGLQAINRGFGGSEMADSVHFADRIVLKNKPRLIVLYAGDNDIAAGKTPERVAADFKEFVAVVRKDLPKTRIVVIAIKPSLRRWNLFDKMRQANALIEAECKRHKGLVYLDVVKPMLGSDGKPRPELFREDGLHLNDKGYRLWVSLLKPYLATQSGWERFRGPNGSGVSRAVSLPARWTEKDYDWKVKLPGSGHSSPVVRGDRVFVTSGDEATGKRFVLCLDAATGNMVWSRAFPGTREGKHQDNSYASATPALDDRHLYVSWGSPREYLVMALDHDGNEAWRVDLGSYKSGHGFGPSPIVCGDVVVVPDDQDGPSAVFGLDRDSGKVRWKAPRRGQSSYSTPCVYRSDGGSAQVILTNWDHGFTSIDPQTGRTNWESAAFDKAHLETAIGSPIVAGDLVLGVCGWLGFKNEVVAVRPDAVDDGGKPRPVYHIDRGTPLVTTPLAVDDLLFLWSDEGVVTCANAGTGEVYWRERVGGSYYGSPVCAGDRLYCISRDGTAVVLAAARKYELLGRNPLGEGSHSTPAIAGGRMYLRTFSHLMALGGRAE